jgi:hypothetical protein
MVACGEVLLTMRRCLVASGYWNNQRKKTTVRNSRFSSLGYPRFESYGIPVGLYASQTQRKPYVKDFARDTGYGSWHY